MDLTQLCKRTRDSSGTAGDDICATGDDVSDVDISNWPGPPPSPPRIKQRPKRTRKLQTSQATAPGSTVVSLPETLASQEMFLPLLPVSIVAGTSQPSQLTKSVPLPATTDSRGTAEQRIPFESSAAALLEAPSCSHVALQAEAFKARRRPASFPLPLLRCPALWPLCKYLKRLDQ
ncbi:hypothetical protein HPB48_005198 [Haemaphysalis longicornis]|uniref:Uncharacterized protein n=1 Tax=Haemaphysalis longicornis TaxID=44386 RepID=A0A9J6FH17_HAELO|nr:hypothetical protein HPB48_005198 [Haemaphysalis longicornis]